MHVNNGSCISCARIFNRFPNFHPKLRAWFEKVQSLSPDAHISCAGRGRLEQEVYFEKGASKAHWKRSAHNYNCAIDIFQLKDGTAMWSRGWFHVVVELQLDPDLKWYGAKDAEFQELPHVEVANWKDLVKNGSVTLVE